jgi:non-ribosomal peptide synthetase component F
VDEIRQEGEFALTLEVLEQREQFVLHLKYQPELYDAATITHMLGHLMTLAEGVMRAPQRALDDYTLLTPAEAARLLRNQVDGQEDDSPVPQHLHAGACLHEVFTQQARATPDAVAVTCDAHALTYAELESRSTTLALYLQRQGVPPDSLVGISVERSLDMLVGILGILKAGAAYVPLDPDYPPERLAYMVRDSAVTLILTQATLAEKIVTLGQDIRTVVLDTHWHQLQQAVRAGGPPALRRAGPAQQLAYVIYTSGSTGTPKGTLVQHDHVVRLFATSDQYFHFGSTDVWTLFHSLSFDFSVWELWGALL